MDNDDDVNKSGRPTAFRDEFVELARNYSKLGATDFEVAEFLGVSNRTIYYWKKAHPAFRRAIRDGGKVADERVKRALYHKAVGYTYRSEKLFLHEGEVIRAEMIEHVPPSDTAGIFWLKNRDPAHWRDRKDLDHSSKDGSMSPSPPSEEDLINRAKRLGIDPQSLGLPGSAS